MSAPAALLAAIAITLVTGLVLITGCGGEPTFTAEEFVERANEEGAALELREPLSSATATEIWSVSFTAPTSVTPVPDDVPSDAPPGAASTDFAHGAGSLAVAADSEAADGEYERCEAAATLVCFRAANVVLRVEGATGGEFDRLEQAIAAVESG